MPRRTWIDGDRWLADDVNAYVVDQTVPTFADDTERDEQWPSPPEGALCYLEDPGEYQSYDGAAWGAFGVGGSGVAEDLTTAETDTDLRLAPDGAGGVEWAVGAGSAPPTCKQSVITAPVTMVNAGQWYDSGASLSLEAGDWLVEADIALQCNVANTEGLLARICDSAGTTVYAGGEIDVVSNNGQIHTLSIRARITLGSTTTVKLQGQGAARTNGVILDTTGAGTDVCTRLIATAVTAA